MNATVSPETLDTICRPIWDEATKDPHFNESSDDMTFEEFKDEVRIEAEAAIEHLQSIGAIRA